ncbi:MAG: RDD family protein [Arenimonas sp.]
MTDKLWHYVDAQQQKNGPVSASIIKEAYQRGELRNDGLVWNADLPQWQRLADHADALGIVLSQVKPLLSNGREAKYANFFHRWAAFVIDQWLVSLSALLLVFCIAAAIYFFAGFSFEKDPDSAGILIFASVFAYMVIYICFSGTYHIHYESSSRQGSLGKQYLGLMVTTDQGEHLDRRTAALRWFSAALSHLSQNIGFLIAAFTEKRQALHDFLANTLVLERETDPSSAPIDRNKRAVIVLIFAIVVMPILMVAGFMLPTFYFIEKQEQATLERHQKIATLVLPIQQAIGKRLAVDQHCLSHDDAEIKPLLQPLKPITTEVYVGISENEETCEIYITWDSYKTLTYNYSGEGDWTCEASHTPDHFGDNCQLID